MNTRQKLETLVLAIGIGFASEEILAKGSGAKQWRERSENISDIEKELRTNPNPYFITFENGIREPVYSIHWYNDITPDNCFLCDGRVGLEGVDKRYIKNRKKYNYVKINREVRLLNKKIVEHCYNKVDSNREFLECYTQEAKRGK